MAPGRRLDALNGAGGGSGAGPRWGAWWADGATQMGGVVEKIWRVAAVWCEGAAGPRDVWPAEPGADEGCWGVGVTARCFEVPKGCPAVESVVRGKGETGSFFAGGKTTLGCEKCSLASSKL